MSERTKMACESGEFRVEVESGIISIAKMRGENEVASLMISVCEGDMLITTYASRHHVTLGVDNNGPSFRIRDEDMK